ncbi:MAG TPA: hypothetical protein VFC46_14395, partial [Humisphaera sp.]|nr:hypothetical protein [Humisphaera sp.]
LPIRASKRAAELILQIAGGKLAGGLVEAGSSGWAPKKLSLRLPRIKQVLGIDLPAAEVVDALRRDHLQPVLRDNHVECSIPSYRLDLNIEVDLIEEVARIAGYDKVPVREEISIRLTQADPGAAAVEAIRSTLVAGGYFESVTFSFVSDALAQDFVPPQASKNNPLMRAEHSVRKADAHLRPSILPGLLESVRHNESAGVAEPRLFEIGSTFWNAAAGQPIEHRCVALVGANAVSDVRGVVETMLARLNSTKAIKVIPDERQGFARGACGRIEWGGEPVGFLGKIDRAVTEKLSLREIPAGAELELEPLLAGMLRTPQLTPLPKFPAIRRDLSLVVPEPVRYEKIETLIRGQKAPNMQDLQYVTTYRGKPLEKGQKSVTVTLVFRSLTETLTGEGVEASMQRVVDAAKQQGWSQRE